MRSARPNLKFQVELFIPDIVVCTYQKSFPFDRNQGRSLSDGKSEMISSLSSRVLFDFQLLSPTVEG